MKNKKFDASKLKILDFKIISGNINAPFDFNMKLIKNYQTDMSFGCSFLEEEKLAKADMGFSIETRSSKNQKVEASVKFDFVYMFEVSNLPKVLDLKEDLDEKKAIETVSTINNLLMAIAAISFSTSRGVLLSRLQGTAMKDYILPIVDPAILLKEWLERSEK